MIRKLSLVHAVAAAVLMGLVVLAAGCGAFGGDQNTFAPGGEVAEKQRDLFFLALWPSIVILILVMGVLVYALVRFRRRHEEEGPPKQVHGNTRLEIAWTIAPAILLIGLAVPTVIGIVDLGRAPKADALQVTVIGRQWFWEFEYCREEPCPAEFTDDEGNPLTTTGQLFVPVDREIGVSLVSPDVIHSFWVPKLAGKQDLVPGRTNRMWFKVDAPGTYPGQCAEFCGLQHAKMKFDVVALEKEEFEAWVEEQMAEQNATLGAAASEE